MTHQSLYHVLPSKVTDCNKDTKITFDSIPKLIECDSTQVELDHREAVRAAAANHPVPEPVASCSGSQVRGRGTTRRAPPEARKIPRTRKPKAKRQRENHRPRSVDAPLTKRPMITQPTMVIMMDPVPIPMLTRI